MASSFAQLRDASNTSGAGRTEIAGTVKNWLGSPSILADLLGLLQRSFGSEERPENQHDKNQENRKLQNLPLLLFFHV